MAVTRNDVARAAGVSPAVVSYVLNEGTRPVSVATRQRVLDAIEKLDYRPNAVARSMRTRRTRSVGLVLPDITYSYFGLVTQSITEVARAYGLSVIVATSNGDSGIERQHLVDLESRRVDGVILMSVDPLQDFGWIDDLAVPVLLVDRPTVATESAEAAVRHLIEHGCTRIGHVTGPSGSFSAQRHKAGWDRAMRAAGLSSPGQQVIVEEENSLEGGYRAARTLLTGALPPDGVVIDTPPQALGFLRSAADLGISIAADVRVVAHELGDAGRYTVPRLTSVDSVIEDVARRSLDALRDAEVGGGLLRLDERDSFRILVRESCGLHREEE